MNKRISSTLLVLVLLLAIPLSGCQIKPQSGYKNIAIENLGNPTATQYPDDSVSRCPWDLTVWDGKVLVGCGDYDKNTGPVDAMVYDPDTKTWQDTATLTTESIARFCTVDTRLLIPGIDPTHNNRTTGEYYEWKEGQWQPQRVLPGGIHCFDLLSFSGMLFSGLGVTQGEYPVAISRDNGQTFAQVPFYKDGAPIETTKDIIRVYDLVALNGRLFALYTAENNEEGKPQEFERTVYEYQNDRFIYRTTWDTPITYNSSVQLPYSAKAVFRNKLFLANNALYQVEEDLTAYSQISFEDHSVILDLWVQEDALYTLNNTPKSDGTFTVSVWRSFSGEAGTFEQMVTFDYATPALSLAVAGDAYYIGIGNPALDHSANGTILCVKENNQ